MKLRTRQRWYLCTLVVAVLGLMVPAAFGVDSGPLDIGTRLLELQQPVVQATNRGRAYVYAHGVDEDMNFMDSPGLVEEGGVGGAVSGQTCVPGGCLWWDEEGNLVDDRFLFAAGTRSDGLRLMRIDGERLYDYDEHLELHDAVAAPNTDKSHFIDAAASDWNGDGYPDFALLYLGKHDGRYAFYLTLVDGRPDWHGKFTCYQEDSWRWTLQSKHDGGMTQGRIAAGDVDGDGRDEIVWAGGDRHTNSGKIALVVHTNLDEEGGLSFYKCPAQYPLESNAGHPVFDLALGYFSEGYIPSNTGYPNRKQIALAVRVENDTVSRRILSWDGQTFSQGNVSSIGDIDFSDNDYLTLTAADMLQQTLSLGDPEYSKVVGQLTPMVVMQAPPRHWDRIGSVDVDAFSAFSGYKTSFNLQSSTTSTTETSSQSSVSSARKLNATGDLSFFKLAGTKLDLAGSRMSAKVKEDLEKDVRTATMKLTGEAAKDDWLYYTFQNLEVWRYPILGQAGQEVADGVTTDQLYYQVVCPDDYTTMTSDGRNKEWYAPVHENQNLLSYPNAVELIEGYPDAAEDVLYGGTDNLIATTVGAEVSGTRTNSFNSVTFEQEKDSHSVTNGVDASLSVSCKVLGATVGGGFSCKHDNAFTETSTNSVNLSNALGFTVAVPEGSSYFFKDGRTAASARFDLYETAFLTKGKRSLVSAYAVDLLGRNGGSLWTDRVTSPYWQMSDPALNLPQKWELQTVAGTYSNITRWVLCESESTRGKLRGGFAYQAEDDWSYDEDVPEVILVMDEPGKIVLRCRVYNYSFVECQNVDVKFSYSYAGALGSGLPTEGDPLEIETVTLTRIPAWTSGDSENWVWAEAEWDTSDLAEEGGYWIHVEIDPDDHVAEIHDTGDEAGNNLGWYEIGLLKEATLEELASQLMDGAITARSAVMEEPESDLEEIDLVMDNMEAGEGETTLLRTAVANNGETPMAMVQICFREYAGGEWNLFDEEIIPVIMPGETRTVEVPFTPTSANSNVKADVVCHMSEKDLTNNSAEIIRSSGSGGCSVAPFSGALMLLPVLLLLKRR